jgi:hypothetical protein
MRTNLIVDAYPTIDSTLLSPPIGRSGSRRLGFEHPMHLLVRSILFRMARRYKFDADSQCAPPSAQPRKASWADGSKGHSIVHTNNFRIAILPEQPHKNPLHRLPGLIGQHTNRQQVTAEHIPNGQRFDPPAIPGTKPALEVHRPNKVAPTGARQSRPLQLGPSRAVATASSQLHSAQPLGDRPHRGNLLPGMLLAQSSSKLFAPPTPMPPPQSANPFQPLRGNLPRRTIRTTSSISKTSPAFSLETPLPLVAILATDSKDPTQLRHASLGLQSQFHELQSPSSRRNLFPRHAREMPQK